MLAAKGFEDVTNLSGGIKGWNNSVASGPEDTGLSLLSGGETPATVLTIAYGLEAGLRDFYLSMIPKVKNSAVKDLFQKLAAIEVKHQDRVFDEYVAVAEKPVSRETFEKTVVADAMEGGLTTEAYVNRFRPDWESARDVVALAMSIEAQALDLYMRAADRADNPGSQGVLAQIAAEEQAHLAQLGKLMDRIE